MSTVPYTGPLKPILSGLEIAAARIGARRSTLPTRKRQRTIVRQPLPHVGKKQLAKMAKKGGAQ